MQSKAATVDAYLAEISDERREITSAIRTMVNRAAPRCQESMAYGMPGWDLGGHWIALAWQRHCLALFVSDPDLVRELALATGSRDFGMSCLRWPSPRHVRLEGLRALIEAAAKRRESLMAANAKIAAAEAVARRNAAKRAPAAKPRVRVAPKKAARPKAAAAKKKPVTKRGAVAGTRATAGGRRDRHRGGAGARNTRSAGRA
jgi:uncharacterized protein YdhG (YjbR/CyaY superfamily)